MRRLRTFLAEAARSVRQRGFSGLLPVVVLSFPVSVLRGGATSAAAAGMIPCTSESIIGLSGQQESLSIGFILSVYS